MEPSYIFVFVLAICAVLSVVSALSALMIWVRCSSLVQRVEETSTTKLAAAQESLADALADHERRTRANFGKLWQRFAPTPRVDAPEQSSLAPPGEACPNWLAAQIDGPRSRAAQCECEYCEGMRAQRRQAKASLVPKGNAARVEAIKRGLQQ